MPPTAQENYSVAVAVFDFLPVLALAAGVIPLARALAARHHALAAIAWSAALLLPFGGFCKANWKLIMALQQQDIDWLESLLFICLAPGFVALGFCFFHAVRAWEANQPAASAVLPMPRLLMWLALPLLGGGAAAILSPDTRLWFFVLLGITTIANAALIWQLVGAARRSGLPTSVPLCFVYNFAATIALSGLSRLPAGEASAWLQEGINLSAQLALAIGMVRLARRMQEKF